MLVRGRFPEGIAASFFGQDGTGWTGWYRMDRMDRVDRINRINRISGAAVGGMRLMVPSTGSGPGWLAINGLVVTAGQQQTSPERVEGNWQLPRNFSVAG